MRISKAIKPILLALGARADKIGGKSLSKIATYVAPYAVDFIEKTKNGEYGGGNEFVIEFTVTDGEQAGTFNIATETSLNDVVAAFKEGKTLIAKVDREDSDVVLHETLPLTRSLLVEEDEGVLYLFCFSATTYDGTNVDIPSIVYGLEEAEILKYQNLRPIINN